MPNEGINANKPKCPKCNKPYWFEGTGISDNDICSCPMPNEREVSDKPSKENEVSYSEQLARIVVKENVSWDSVKEIVEFTNEHAVSDYKAHVLATIAEIWKENKAKRGDVNSDQDDGYDEALSELKSRISQSGKE